MALPFITYLRNRLKGSQLNSAIKTKVLELLEGVKSADGKYYIYSCPFPFFLDASQDGLADAFSLKLIEAAGRLVLVDPRTNRARSDVELFEDLFAMNDSLEKVAIYPGYASGDMYGFGAALAINPNLRLLIMSDSANPKRIDRTNATYGFLKEIVSEERLAKGSAPMVFAKNPNPERNPKKQELEYLKALDTKLWTIFRATGKIHCAVDLFFATRYVAHKFVADPSRQGEPRKSSRKAVRDQWLELGTEWNLPLRKKLEAFLAATTQLKEGESARLPEKANIVVLWSRFTGKTGGAHVEYDTSFTGLRQLVRCAFASGAEYVCIAGDAPKSSNTFTQEQKEKRARVLAELRAEIIDSPRSQHGKFSSPGKGLTLRPRRVVDLTEFWNRPEWSACFGVPKPKRIDQFKLFEILAQKNNVKHFGARSGNLESLALLGYTVRYFEDGSVDRSWESDGDLAGFFEGPNLVTTPEPVAGPVAEPGAPDKQRMEPWHDTVGYKRIKIAKVPTRSGKYLIERKLNGQPDWTYDKRRAPAVGVDAKFVKPDMKALSGEDLVKGFSVGDLTEIASYFSFS